MTLRELQASLEAASDGSRELDFAIFETLFAAEIEGCKSGPSGWMQLTTATVARPEQFTTSLDAAVALCERVLPGWEGVITTTGTAHVLKPGTSEVYTAIVEGKTPLALCRAIFAALAAQEPADAGE